MAVKIHMRLNMLSNIYMYLFINIGEGLEVQVKVCKAALPAWLLFVPPTHAYISRLYISVGQKSILTHT